LAEIEELHAHQDADDDTIEQLQEGWKAQVVKDQAELNALKEQNEEEMNSLKEQVQDAEEELRKLRDKHSLAAKELEIHKRHKPPPPFDGGDPCGEKEIGDSSISKSAGGALLSPLKQLHRKVDYDGSDSGPSRSSSSDPMDHANTTTVVDTMQQQHDQVMFSLREDHAEALQTLQAEHDTLLKHYLEENAEKLDRVIHEHEQQYSVLLTKFNNAINPLAIIRKETEFGSPSEKSVKMKVPDMLAAIEEMKAIVDKQEHNLEEIAALHTHVDKLQTEIKSKEAQLNEFRQSVALHVSVKDDIHEQHQATKAEKEKEISSLQQVVGHLRIEVAEQSDKINHYEKTQAEKEEDLKALQNVVEMLKSEVSDKDTEKSSAEAKLAEFQAAIETLHATLEEQKALMVVELEAKETRIEELTAALEAVPPPSSDSEVAQQLADALAEIEELHAHQDADDDTIEQLQEGWKAQVVKDQAELNALKEQNEEEIVALQQELDQVEAERDHTAFIIEDIKIKIEEAVDEMTSLTTLRTRVLELVAAMPQAEAVKHVENVRVHEEELNSSADTPSASEVAPDGFDFTAAVKMPIVHIEMGSFEMKLRVYDVAKETFVLKACCPSITASEKGSSGKNMTANSSLVQYASRFADPMFEYFRENGIFIGNDAIYCCFDHPDITLRGKLVIDDQAIVDQSGRIASQGRFDHLFKYLLNKGGYTAESVQLLFSFNGCFYEAADACKIGDALFGEARCRQVCFVQEHALALAAVYNQQLDKNLTVGSALLIQVGATRTTIVPVFESMVLRSAIRHAAVGGESITDLLDLMLHAQEDEGYMKLLSRRRKSIARAIKEQHAFACMGQESYDEALTRYGGAFSFDSIKVMPSVHDAAGKNSKRNYAKGTRKKTDIDAAVDTLLPDGTNVKMVIGKERFICVEALFQPKLLRSALGAEMDYEGEHDDQHLDLEHGLIDATLAAVQAIDADVRQDICSTIILSGSTINLRGLQDRLKIELDENLTKYGVSNINLFADDIMANGATTYVTHPDYSEVRSFVSGETYHAHRADIGKYIL